MAHTNRIQNVAVVGASGHLGRHFAEELVNSGHTVTALTRKDSKSKLVDGLKMVPIDYDDEQSLVEALRCQQFLVITLPVTATPDLHSRLVHAAAKAGVNYIMPNAYGADINNEGLVKEDMFTGGFLKHIEDIKSVGGSHITMCCGFWYEWSLALGQDFFGFDIPNKKVIFFDDGETKINATTWRQCGRALAALLSLPEDAELGVSTWKNKPFYVSSFRISQRDILDSIHRVSGSTDADWDIKYEPTSKRYAEGVEQLQKGDRSAFAKVMCARLFYPGDSDYETSKGLANNQLRLPEEELDLCTESVVDGWNPFG